MKSTVPKKQSQNVIEKVIKTTGIKPAANPIHNMVRIILLIGITIYIIYLGTQEEDDKKISSLDDVSDIIKPGSLIYRTAQEMDDKTRKHYLKSMLPMLTPNPPPIKKYIKSVKFALIAGVLSEYIVNGNTSKPMGVIAKTVLYTIIYNVSNDD